MYEPGDIIPSVGEVDSNHCGLPWPVGMTTNETEGMKVFTYYGVVSVITNNYHGAEICYGPDGRYLTPEEIEYRIQNSHVMCDAITGRILTPEEIEERRDNEEFDYNGRRRNNTGRRHKNNPPAEIYREWNWLHKWWYRVTHGGFGYWCRDLFYQ